MGTYEVQRDGIEMEEEGKEWKGMTQSFIGIETQMVVWY